MDRRPPRPYLVPAPPLDLPERHHRGRPGGYRDRMDAVLDRAERVRADLAAVRETASSPDGAVVATVDGSGTLTGLRFGPRASGLAPEALAELVLVTAADAAAAATRRAVGLLERVAGRPAR